MFTKAKNHGVILTPRRPADWSFGGTSGIDNVEPLREDGQWDNYLPVFEKQSNVNFDTMGCVTFSALNAVETLLYRKFGIQRNFSDRYTAKISGTTINGNSPYDVADAIHNKGLLDEGEWPFFGFFKTRDEYYAEIPSTLIEKAMKIYDEFKINYEFVEETPDKLKNSLKYAPIQVCIHAYGSLSSEGIYERSTARANHAVLLYGFVDGQYWKIYDHYDNKFKKLAWDSMFWCAVKYDINKFTPSMMQFKPNCLYQIVEGTGGFCLYIAGKMRQDSLDKLLASWLVVNSGKVEGQVGTLTLKDLEGVTLYNLKGERI